jgi:protease-4
MTKTLRRLREDDAVRAIVVRMDSPGGSPLASDLIWREMMLTREEKPVIVSIGGMSASGGYYIASGASTIVASPSAIVGSIGVFGGKIVIGGAFEKLGVTHHQVAASPEEGAAARATHMSPLSEWDEATRERVRGTMRRIYDLFVERVAEGRNLPKEKVYSTAEGEIFLATVGRERGLIDELGGIEKALSLARQQAKLPDNIPVTIEGTEESILESLLLGEEPSESEVETALLSFERRRFERLSAFALGEHVATLRPFAAALAPLLEGEQVVAALPYALELR